MLDKIDKIASIIQSFAIALLSFFAFMQFRYKHDAEIRKMLIENYKKFEPISNDIIATGEASVEKFKDLWEIFDEAELCFHVELVNFIKEFRSKYGELYVNQKRLENPKTEEERLKRIDNWETLLLQLIEDLKKMKKVYRKQILEEPWNDIKDFWKNQWKTSITKSCLDKFFKK
jgi:hypothetical protein